MGCPFGFAGQQQTTALTSTYYDLKQKASDIALELMCDAGITAEEMRDVCIALLVSYRVEKGERCREIMRKLHAEHNLQLTKLCIAVNNIEEYVDHTFAEDDNFSTLWAVRSLVGHQLYHNVDKFIKDIDGMDETK